MSNLFSLLALPVCSSSTTVEEPTNHVISQDAHELQDVPGAPSPNLMPSNAEAHSPPTLNQKQDDGSGHQSSTEGTMPPASGDHQSSSVRELNNLKSVNPPGRLELDPLPPTRNRSPSLQKAQTIYQEAVRAIQRELAEFEAQRYLFKPREDLPSSDIRPRYRRLRMRKQALLLASEDLCPLLERRGLMQDVRKTREEVDLLLTPITNIKLTYKDVVSNVTGSARQEADVESIEQNPPIH